MKGRLLLAALSALFLTLSAAPSARAQDEAIAAGDARRTERGQSWRKISVVR